ncbi:hypothetical protein [Roseibium sp. Sym1]|uniref:hypothetical protein n=1 Tax=Roseibium sp. Sym1 TaxID=3016006 RepID=UPI0022B35799|nr:hypothetical protein [Roseibium sp. Sym1]
MSGRIGNSGTPGRRAVFRAAALAVAATMQLCGPVRAAGSALSDEPIPMVTEEEVLERRQQSNAGGGLLPSGGHHSSELSDKPVPIVAEEDVPEPTPPIFQRGEKFLASGNLSPGIELPTGAIWQPALWVFGDARTAIGHYASGVDDPRQFWASRLDIFANLKLTPTERVLIGFSPLTEGTRNTGILYTDEGGVEYVNGLNPYVTTLFFEGEFGEIFPNLDPDDRRSIDFGFSIGRQPLFFQEGMMINDSVDALGITRDTIIIPGLTPDLRATGVFGWNNIRRGNNRIDDSAYLFGLFTEADFRKSTGNLDLAYVVSDEEDGGDGFYFGASAVQRLGHYNTAFRINTSTAIERTGPAVDNGVLLFSEISRTLTGSENIVYANAFWALGNYTSAARDSLTGGPLGQVGILFAAPSVGLGGSALSNRADDVFGGSIGHQMFFNEDRTQLVLELGGRKGTDGRDEAVVAFGGQLLHALNNRSSIQVDGFVSGGRDRKAGTGLRMELRTRF